MVKLRSYPKYKDSGIPWLAEIPAHWKQISLRAITQPKTVRERPELPLLSVYRDYGVILRASRDDNHNRQGEDLSTYKVVERGDLVLNKMKTWQGSLGVSEHDGIVSPAYIVCSLSSSINPRYLHLLLRSRPYIGHYNQISFGVRVNQWDMRYEHFKQVSVLLPERSEQDSIVRFLDRTDHLMNRLIRTKQRLIELLGEQKQAIVHRAVTRGLDPDVPMKPTGLDWLPEVPEGWEVRKLRSIAQIERGRFSHRPRNDVSLYGGDYPFIQTGDVARANKVITAFQQTLNDKGQAISRQFPAGTLIMAIAANIGDVAILGFDACFPDSLVGLFPRQGISRDFLYYGLVAMRPEILREAPVNTQGNLSISRMTTLYLPIPPADQQTRIARMLEQELSTIDKTITRARREIGLIREYRTRLVSDVVTGKLDVRGVELPKVEEANMETSPNGLADLEAEALSEAEEVTVADL